MEQDKWTFLCKWNLTTDLNRLLIFWSNAPFASLLYHLCIVYANALLEPKAPVLQNIHWWFFFIYSKFPKMFNGEIMHWDSNVCDTLSEGITFQFQIIFKLEVKKISYGIVQTYMFFMCSVIACLKYALVLFDMCWLSFKYVILASHGFICLS